MTVVPPPGDGAGNSGDTLADGEGEVVAVSSADVVVEVVVVVVSLVESSPPQPVASEPAAIPAASANRAEFETTLRVLMTPVVTRRDGS
jgi:hypothetical protein